MAADVIEWYWKLKGTPFLTSGNPFSFWSGIANLQLRSFVAPIQNGRCNL